MKCIEKAVSILIKQRVHQQSAERIQESTMHSNNAKIVQTLANGAMGKEEDLLAALSKSYATS